MDLPPRRAFVAESLLPSQSVARWWQTRAIQGKRASSWLDSPPVLPALPPIHHSELARADCFPPATLPIADSRQNSPRLRVHQGQAPWWKRGPAYIDHVSPGRERRCIPAGFLPEFPMLEYRDRSWARPAAEDRRVEASAARSKP